jgi:hypothetical protein
MPLLTHVAAKRNNKFVVNDVSARKLIGLDHIALHLVHCTLPSGEAGNKTSDRGKISGSLFFIAAKTRPENLWLHIF